MNGAAEVPSMMHQWICPTSCSPNKDYKFDKINGCGAYGFFLGPICRAPGRLRELLVAEDELSSDDMNVNNSDVCVCVCACVHVRVGEGEQALLSTLYIYWPGMSDSVLDHR